MLKLCGRETRGSGLAADSGWRLPTRASTKSHAVLGVGWGCTWGEGGAPVLSEMLLWETLLIGGGGCRG